MGRGRASRVTLVALVIAGLAGCPRRAPVAPPPAPAGLAIAIYAHGAHGFAVIDDRRSVEVAGGALVLDRIDPDVTLPSLVIEPLTAGLAVGGCARDRIDGTPDGLAALAGLPRRPAAVPPPPPTPPAGDDGEDGVGGDGEPVAPPPAPAPARGPSRIDVLSPLVRCAVTGRPGRHFVRLVYVSSLFRYRVQHELAQAGGERAAVVTRFAVATPRWDRTAEVALFDGVPGAAVPPRELVRGAVALDGGTAVLAQPRREVPGRLRHVYDGGIANTASEPGDAAWRRDSRVTVWVWLELDDPALPAGAARVHVERPGEVARDIAVPASAGERRGDAVRFPLWIDGSLRGVRTRAIERTDEASLADRFELSVWNLGDAPREVWIEEHLRPVKRAVVIRARPVAPVRLRDIVRTKVIVPPRGVERTSYTIDYDL